MSEMNMPEQCLNKRSPAPVATHVQKWPVIGWATDMR